MAERRAEEPAFGVETVHLDLAPLAGVFGQRLRAAGVPVTPGRSADFARALAVVRPVSRRRLYWTARSLFVSDEGQVRAVDRVFREVFGGGAAPLAREIRDNAGTEPAAADDRQPGERERVTRERAREAGGPDLARSAPGEDEATAEVEVPRAGLP